MDQSVLAGLGNLYADEALFQTGLHPEARAGRLHADTLRALHRAIRSVLCAAIRAHVDASRMPRRFLLPHRHAGGACPRCGRELTRKTLGGRTRYFCQRDQRRRR